MRCLDLNGYLKLCKVDRRMVDRWLSQFGIEISTVWKIQETPRGMEIHYYQRYADGSLRLAHEGGEPIRNVKVLPNEVWPVV